MVFRWSVVVFVVVAASGGATAAAAAGGDGTAVVVSVLVVVVDAPQCPARLRQACFGRYRDPLAFLDIYRG